MWKRKGVLALWLEAAFESLLSSGLLSVSVLAQMSFWEPFSSSHSSPFLPPPCLFLSAENLYKSKPDLILPLLFHSTHTPSLLSPPTSHKPVSYQQPTSPKVSNLQRIGGSKIHAREPLHHDNHQGEARSQGKPALQSLPSLKTTGNTTRRIQRNNTVPCGIGGHCMPWEYKVQDLNQWHSPLWLWQTLRVQLLIRNPLKTFENHQIPKRRPSNDGDSTGHIQLLSCLILSVPEGRQGYPQVTDDKLNFFLVRTAELTSNPNVVPSKVLVLHQ